MKELEESFMNEFKQLLRSYDAQFEIVDIGIEYESNNVAEIYFIIKAKDMVNFL